MTPPFNKSNVSLTRIIKIFQFYLNFKQALQKKLSFPLMILTVNVTKSAGNWEFGHIY